MTMQSGKFGWNELATTDTDAAAAFFGTVLGWTRQTVPSPTGQGEYHLFLNGEEQVAGMMAMDGPEWQGIPPHWLSYVMVEDIDGTTAKVQSAGGRVLNGPFDIPGIGRMAVISDPTGATLALMTPTDPPA